MGKLFNFESTGKEIDAIISLFSGKGKKFIMKKYGFLPEEAAKLVSTQRRLVNLMAKEGETIIPDTKENSYLYELLRGLIGEPKDDETKKICLIKRKTGGSIMRYQKKNERIPHTISDELIFAILQDKEGSNAELAKRYGISATTVWRIRTGRKKPSMKIDDECAHEVAGISVTQHTADNKEYCPLCDAVIEPSSSIIEEESTPSQEQPEFDPCNDSSYVSMNRLETFECGLADRHDIPCKRFIFGRSISSDLMFDFNGQKRIIRKFIENHMKFDDGKCMQILKLYATGLQSILASVISVCNEIGVPMSIMHYNRNTNEYEEQSVLGGSSADCSIEINKFLEDFDEVLIFKKDADNVFNQNTYTVQEIHYTDDGESISKSCIKVFSDINDAYTMYSKLRQDLEVKQSNACKHLVLGDCIQVILSKVDSKGDEEFILNLSTF